MMRSKLSKALKIGECANGSKIPLFDFFSAFAEGMSLRYDAIFIRAFGAPSIYPLSLCLIMTKK